MSDDFAKITAKASECIASEIEKILDVLSKDNIFRLMFFKL
jgi:hypothetical protein